MKERCEDSTMAQGRLLSDNRDASPFLVPSRRPVRHKI